MAREQRKLAAILAADVVGYSRLMGRDESGTLARLRENRSKHLDPVLAKYGGRLVKLTGDGALIEYASAVDALSAAIEFQQAMAEVNREQSADTALVFRMGLHLGDLIVDGDDLYGDSVNIAARLEAEAPAGGIVISRTVQEAVTGRVKAAFGDLGSLSLKNIERPIQAFSVKWEASDWLPLLGSGGAVAAAAAPEVRLPLPDKPSIAVLPFQNMSGDPEQEYFVDGIAEDITTALSRFRELFVIARNSSFTYKGKAVNVRQVANELGVRYVLEGSSRKAGNRIRVTAQLIDCESGNHLWAERYDRELADIFAVQEDIARIIVACIAPAIEASTLARIGRLPPANLTAYEIATRAWSEAWEAYLSGEAAVRDRAFGSARRALQLDENCVRAWTVMAAVHWQAEYYSQRQSTPESCRDGLEAARRAIALDRFEHAGHIYKALFHLRLLQYDDALAELGQAREINPNDAVALQALGFAELMNGDPASAKASCLEALRLNPRDPIRYNAYSILANICFLTEEYDEGLTWVAQSKREHPDFRPTIMTAIKLYVGLGQIDQARAEADRVRTPDVEARIRAGLSQLRQPEHREREIRFFRLGFGLDTPGSA